MKNDIIKKLPNIERSELNKYFSKIDLEDYPELDNYSWEDCHKGSMGAGDLFLTSELAKKMNLKEGIRILELGAGNCLSSIYLAKKYDVEVFAADLYVNPNSNWEKIKEENVEDNVIPIKMDARDIPFPENYFDIVFSMNSYFYFGTDDSYSPYLLNFIKANGLICIASPCFAEEFKSSIPEEFLFDLPDNLESYLIHSPDWWENHFQKMGLVKIIECSEHPKGREFWLDSIRWRIKSGDKMEDFMQDIIILLKDEKNLLSYFTLIAEKNA